MNKHKLEEDKINRERQEDLGEHEVLPPEDPQRLNQTVKYLCADCGNEPNEPQVQCELCGGEIISQGISKYLYCPVCKCYPDKVMSEENCQSRRIWDGQCYETIKQEYSDEEESYFCEVCNTKLMDKS